MSPAAEWDQDSSRRALDELFSHAGRYRSSQAYRELLDFVARFRYYAPFNAMLVHIQMPGATYVAPASRWFSNYRRRVNIAARPLVILQPMGPVMFVFDVADTEPEPGSPPLPIGVDRPFEVRAGRVGAELDRVIENAIRDGIRVSGRDAGSQSAGEIRTAPSGDFLEMPAPGGSATLRIPLRYEVLLNSKHPTEAKYATLVHELGHLYCGHLGSPNNKWWPDRSGLTEAVREFEAESVCYLVCRRLGIDNPSETYLAGYTQANPEVPPISLDSIMKASGLIERMGREYLGPRRGTER